MFDFHKLNLCFFSCMKLYLRQNFLPFLRLSKTETLEASLNIEYFSLIQPISFQAISNYLLPYASKVLSQLLSKVFKYSKNWQLFS